RSPVMIDSASIWWARKALILRYLEMAECCGQLPLLGPHRDNRLYRGGAAGRWDAGKDGDQERRCGGDRVDERLDAAERIPRRIRQPHPEHGENESDTDSWHDQHERAAEHVAHHAPARGAERYADADFPGPRRDHEGDDAVDAERRQDERH